MMQLLEALGLNLTPGGPRSPYRFGTPMRPLPVRHRPAARSGFGRRHRPIPPPATAALPYRGSSGPSRRRPRPTPPTWRPAAPTGRERAWTCPTSTGQRTPNRPDATGVFRWFRVVRTSRGRLRPGRRRGSAPVRWPTRSTRGHPSSANPAHRPRARNPAVQQLAPAIFGTPVHVPPTSVGLRSCGCCHKPRGHCPAPRTTHLAAAAAGNRGSPQPLRTDKTRHSAARRRNGDERRRPSAGETPRPRARREHRWARRARGGGVSPADGEQTFIPIPTSSRGVPRTALGSAEWLWP